MSQTSASTYKSAEKIYHRRSLLGRLWRRPILLTLVVFSLAITAGMATRQYLGLLGVLPAQRHAKAAAGALDQLIAQPEFGELVASPIEGSLGQTVGSLKDVGALLIHIRRSQPIATDFRASYRRPESDPSPTVAAWRNVIDSLRARGFDVFAYPQLAAKGDRLLRDAITQRLYRFDSLARQRALTAIDQKATSASPADLSAYGRAQRARTEQLVALVDTFMRGTNPADYDLPTGPLDNAQRAVVRSMHITRTELDLIFYLNQSAIDMNNEDAGS